MNLSIKKIYICKFFFNTYDLFRSAISVPVLEERNVLIFSSTYCTLDMIISYESLF